MAVKKSELMLTRVRTLTVKEQLVELLMSGPYWTVAVSGCFIMMGYFAPFGFLYGKKRVNTIIRCELCILFCSIFSMLKLHQILCLF